MFDANVTGRVVTYRKATSTRMLPALMVAESELAQIHSCLRCGSRLHTMYTDPKKILKSCGCGLKYVGEEDKLIYEIQLNSTLFL